MSFSNRVILVVDDDPDICWALEHVLGRVGARCIRALDGRTALQATQLNRLDLILLDAKLPDMDGLEVARQIHSAEPGLPILLVSGYFYKDDLVIQDALAQGLICGFVEKPFLHAAIIAAMETALGSHPATATAVSP
ncbi:MAG: response regulator [Bryobacteraceae bacterium]|jgi:CheY-like chemotaxis protein